MKSFTSIQLAAAGLLSLVSVTQAQSLCAVNCFQQVITDHPPLSCTESSMYLCFCKSSELQNYFVDCAYDKCASEAEGTVEFGVNLCAELGVPITVPARPTTTSAAAQESQPTSAEPEPTSSDVLVVSSSAASAATTGAESSSAAAESSSAVESSSAAEYPASSEPAYVEPGKSAIGTVVVPTPTEETTPAHGQPTHVVVSMGTSSITAPSLIVGAVAAMLAAQLL